eukprot:GABV01001347.1.p1 GENE.GABV01001347.1~~GABV01001347.1.p1  ORF type:complete len:294 (-),score=85.02 GABV01001347.1:8-889(-)
MFGAPLSIDAPSPAQQQPGWHTMKAKQSPVVAAKQAGSDSLDDDANGGGENIRRAHSGPSIVVRRRFSVAAPPSTVFNLVQHLPVTFSSLVKKQTRMKTWHFRQIVLKGDQLLLRKPHGKETIPAEQLPYRAISLADYHASIIESDRKHPHMIELVKPEARTFRFSCATSEEALRWVELINAVAFTPSMDEFEIIKRLGEGAFSSVYLVRHTLTRRLYALKTIHKNQKRIREALKQTAMERAILEHAAVAACAQDPPPHPGVRHLAQLRFAWQTRIAWHFVLDYFPHGDLVDF